MRFHEDFTRCECGEAYLKKDEYVLGSYQKNAAGQVVGFKELPDRREIRYSCGACNEHIFTTRE